MKIKDILSNTMYTVIQARDQQWNELLVEHIDIWD